MIERNVRPPLVSEARERAERLGFELSSEETVGRLLAVLAATVPPGGRILELGTGAGVGLAWIACGVGRRSDVQVISIESHGELHRELSRTVWPPCVELVLGDGADYVSTESQFDLIFADAPGGKLENLGGTIASLKEGGILVVDDMDLEQHDASEADLRRALVRVRAHLLSDARLLTVELETSSGIMVCARRA